MKQKKTKHDILQNPVSKRCNDSLERRIYRDISAVNGQIVVGARNKKFSERIQFFCRVHGLHPFKAARGMLKLSRTV